MFREMTSSHGIALSNDDMAGTAPSVLATKPHFDVSEKYGFIPTIEVVDALRKNGWFPVDATQKNVRMKDRVNFTKHLVRFRRLNDDIMVGDNIVELLLTNSHDRSSGFILHAGIFRMACANGIVVADSTFQKVSVRHSRYAAERVVEGSHEVVREVPVITGQIEEMQAIQLDRAEQEIFARTALDYIMPEDKEGDAPKIYTERGQLVNQMLRPNRPEDRSNDLWTTYNVIQEKVLRGGLRMYKESRTGRSSVRRTTTREVKNIDKNIKLNKALWEMAAQMKSLKREQAA